MVIDISDMGNVGLELVNHPPNALACFRGIDRVQCEAAFSCEAGALFEIGKRNKVPVEWRRRATIIGHGKQGGLVAARPHYLHGFKQVCFGPAEPEVVLVAVQDAHENFLVLVSCLRDDGGNLLPKCRGSADD